MSNSNDPLLTRPSDRRNITMSIFGGVIVIAGLILLYFDHDWHPVVPIVIGAAFLNPGTIIDLIKAWKTRKDDGNS